MIRVDGTGVQADDFETNLAELRELLQAAFGADLSLAPQTPQGQIAGIQAAALAEIGEAMYPWGLSRA